MMSKKNRTNRKHKKESWLIVFLDAVAELFEAIGMVIVAFFKD